MTLFNSQLDAEPAKQTGLDLTGNVIPQSLSDKYRPTKIEDFIGLEKQRKVLSAFAKRPCACAWLFLGPSGVGKSTMALALAEEIQAELHKIPSQNCNVQSIEDVCRTCAYVPMFGKQWHAILADEADAMTPAAQLKLLSKLDATDSVAQTIWLFTANDTARLEPRFLSRCRVLEFSSYGLRAPLAELLAKIWDTETGGKPSDGVNFERIAKDSNTNPRAALQALEIELLAA
jgi:replication-associated recombination protein RarA